MSSENNFDLFREIKPKRLSDEIFEQIKTLIFQGKLKPGDKLPPERELAENFNVGRSCLREALIQLSTVGLLEVKKKNGYYIRSISDEMVVPLKKYLESEISNLIDFLEFRKLLDIYCVEKAIEYGSDTDIQKIKQAYENNDSTGFHIAIAEATHNIIFVHLVTTMHTLLSGISYIKQFGTLGNEVYRKQHESILTALLQRDIEKARAAVNNHLSSYIDEAKKAKQTP